jgi:signal transduction histidine kinase
MQAGQESLQTFSEDDLREMVLRLAHEIRNPLATIQSAVQLLEHRHQPEAEDLELYQSIYKEVSRLDQVVRDMQALVRLSAQTTMLVDVGRAVTVAVESELSRSSSRHDDIRVVGGPDVAVLVDHRHLEGAFGELLDNALRFSEPGSQVEISWNLVGETLVSIDFEDQGPGIAAKHTPSIMRPFFSTSTQGTGLGLNIVARTAYLARGRLEWCNRDSGGARFSLLLPVVKDTRDSSAVEP